MPYFLYAKPDGSPDISDWQLDLNFFPGYQFIGQYEAKPDFVENKKYVNGQWVWGLSEPEYSVNRRCEYPTLGDQLDMIWHAMDAGQITKVDSFYDAIKQIKDKYPKP